MNANIEALVAKQLEKRFFTADDIAAAIRSAMAEQAEAFKGEQAAYDGMVRELTKTVEDMRDGLASAERERDELRKDAEQLIWHPIATAPDNEMILMFQPHRSGGFIFAGVRNTEGDWVNNLDGMVQEPTLWIPHENLLDAAIAQEKGDDDKEAAAAIGEGMK